MTGRRGRGFEHAGWRRAVELLLALAVASAVVWGLGVLAGW